MGRRVSVLRRAAGSVLVVLAVAVFGSGVAQAAPKPAFTVSSAPTSVAAGSAENAIVFSFVASDPVQASVSIDVPGVASGSPWTAPQSQNAAGAGYVSAAAGTCNAAQVASVTGPAGGPWTILVNAKCAKGKTFSVTYGGGSGTKVTAATRAGNYAFTTKVLMGGSFLALSPQPVVTVTPGQASSLVVSGLVDAVADTALSPTVTATDAFGNTAPDYRGTVHFSVSGPLVAYHQPVVLYPGYDHSKNYRELPADYTFSAADGGTHTFASSLRIVAAGDQTLTAADTATGTIKGTQTVTISHDEFAGLDLLTPVTPRTSRVNVIVPRTRMTVAAFDVWGNIARATNGVITMRYSADRSGTPGDLPSQLTLVDGTASADVTWPTSDDGSVTVNIRGSLPTDVFPFFEETFTREFDQRVYTVTADARVITLAPQSYSLSLPSQNLTLKPQNLFITQVAPSPVQGLTQVKFIGQTTNNDTVTVTATVSTPIDSLTGKLVLDDELFATPGTPLEVSPISLLPNDSFVDVQVIDPTTPVLTYTLTTNTSNMSVAVVDLTDPECQGSDVWHPETASC